MNIHRFSLIVIFWGLSCVVAYAQGWPDIALFFEGYKACFVLYDVKNDTVIRYNEKRCQERISPCSTFKIPNSLIGLETGVIPDESHVFPWDGIERQIKSWNRDHDLRSAIANSVVWYYQKLAVEVGERRMKEYLQKLNYGNMDISGGLTQFWLGSSLKISANEQIDFLLKLYRNDLPFLQQSIDIVKEITILSRTDDVIFRGKTGSGFEEGKRTWGWFVGYIERKENVFIFATHIEAKENAFGIQAKEITKNILKSLSLL
ncbi:MAG: class D beta-lactamase [Candidatus Omnitrophica bacterium]|nr:class D beta-lactamase [Candidatus Omnitrophota bacterium]